MPVFKSGNSQVVRIPYEIHFDTAELEIFQRNDEIVLRKKAQTLEQAFHLLAVLPADVDINREDAPPQVCDGL